MRVGVNALYLIPGGVGGTEIYLRRLLGAMARLDTPDEFFLYLNRETDDALAPPSPRFHRARMLCRAENRPWRIVWEQTALPLALERDRIDVVFNAGTTAPLIGPPSVTVFHDMHYIRHPEDLPALHRPVWNALMGAAARVSRRIVAVSDATRDDFLTCYPGPAARVVTIHHGVEPQFFDLQRGPAEPFLLCVSTLHPHKNLDRLVRAFAWFQKKHPEYRLVLVGLRGYFAEQLEREIARLDLVDAVRITGWIEREALYDLFRKAAAFVYPSRFEGFGMPVAEAMAAGVPVACSAIPPLQEVAGEAALFFDPHQESEMADALERLVCDPELRRRLAALGRARAERFRWETAARATLDVLRQAAGEASRPASDQRN
jgi:glycosyltransferase involved in cell wall biosynthesis